MPDYDSTKRCKDRHERELIGHGNVTHVAVVKIGDDYAIELGLVAEESSPSARGMASLPDALPVPDLSGNTSGAKDSVPVTKRVVGRAFRRMFTERQRPALGGDSIGVEAADTGTLGALWKINDANYVISCYHVLYLPHGANNDDVLQPGPFDGGAGDADAIAQNTYGEMTERLDIAFAALVGAPGEMADYGTRCSGEISGHGDAKDGMKVSKCGRTTEQTDGVVRSTDASVDFGDGIVHTDQLLIDLESRSGDSGSLIIETKGKIAVGVLMGSNEGLNLTYANKFSNVIDAGIRNLPHG